MLGAMVMSIVYESKTGVIRRCLFDVHNDVGVGRDEEDYHKALALCFRENDIPFVSKQPHPLMLYGAEAHRLFPDFTVWQSITVELKSVPRRLTSTEFVQLFDYLKRRGDSLGLLVNMGLDRVFVDRVVYQPGQSGLSECWDYWSGVIDGKSREVGLAVRQVLRDIFHEHGSGYGAEVVSKLILYGLRHRGLKVVENPIAEASYAQTLLRKSSLSCVLVEDRIVLCHTALFDDNQYNRNRCKSYMKALGLRWGIAANFGKARAEMTGMRRQ